MLLNVGCNSDFKLYPIIDDIDEPVQVPDITVTPVEVNFGALNADGESATEVIVIGNDGSETLYIDAIELNIASSVFSITALEGEDSLEPNDFATFTVTYDPKTYEFNENSIVILSNDPDEYESHVWIDGSGDAPVIDITPADYDFGNTLIGCEEVVEVTISNIGNVDLVIDRIDYFVTFPADLGIYDFEAVYGPLPWTLAPGESMVLEIFYYPTDVDIDYGSIEVYSNDPQTPLAEAEQEAIGIYDGVYEETFEQDNIDSVDIMFIVDNSCSMNDKQTQLANNFDTFMNVFIVSGIDYHIGFATTDSGSMEGSLITPSTIDPVTVVADIIDDIGTSGSPTERGIDNAYDGLQTGQDFGPGSTFWRTDSKLIIIFVSDEEDNSSTDPITLKNYVVAIKGSADYVTAHAVAGDYPGGCTTNGGGQEAYIYYTIVNELNGSFLSICADDWGTPMETLAHDSILKNTFTLTKDAVEDTLYVEVNGVESTEWRYDFTTNSISFNDGHTPEHGATIYISYNPISECEP
tara:strand:+ start:7238 stop:8806 length:1569 start_codon:yes stop_codon:yes gene_type:complete